MRVTPRDLTTSIVRTLFSTSLLIGLFATSAPRVDAGLFTLTDDNSTARFDTDTQSNAFDWIVDGVDHLAQQAFWYRVGNAAEQSLDTLPHPVEGTSDTNFDGNQDNLFVRYNGEGFRIEVNYRLDGGTAGSLASDISEQISIINTSTAPLDFHFFQYSDFDLAGSAANDLVVFTNPNAVQQSEGLQAMTETVNTPVASHREADFFAVTLNKLNDAVATTLNDAPPYGVVLGPGDMTWAYQWDVVIPGLSSFLISKDKQITGVPEPSSVLLAALAGVAVLRMRSRRQTG